MHPTERGKNLMTLYRPFTVTAHPFAHSVLPTTATPALRANCGPPPSLTHLGHPLLPPSLTWPLPPLLTWVLLWPSLPCWPAHLGPCSPTHSLTHLSPPLPQCSVGLVTICFVVTLMVNLQRRTVQVRFQVTMVIREVWQDQHRSGYH